jgi:hypothetical protein
MPWLARTACRDDTSQGFQQRLCITGGQAAAGWRGHVAGDAPARQGQIRTIRVVSPIARTVRAPDNPATGYPQPSLAVCCHNSGS